MNKNKLITRTALILALTLIVQSLRMIMPIPVFFSTFLIGSLVNACLLMAIEIVGTKPAITIAVLTPVMAYMQQMLILPVFIIPVAIGNAIYIVLFKTVKNRGKYLAVFLAALSKALVLYLSFKILISMVDIPIVIANGLIFVMSWPQFITALIGGGTAMFILRRISISVS